MWSPHVAVREVDTARGRYVLISGCALLPCGGNTHQAGRYAYRPTRQHPKILRTNEQPALAFSPPRFRLDVHVAYTGALLPLLPEPATLSTSVETTGRLSRFPSTGVALRAWTAIGMNGPNRLRNPITCDWSMGWKRT